VSVDLVAEQAAVVTRLSTLCGGRVWDAIEEEVQLEFDAEGLVKPYIIVSFGTLYPKAGDRSIEGPTQQPYVLPITIECWGSTASQVRSTAGAVRTLLLGWAPSENNASEIELRGGSWFPNRRDTDARPTRYLQTVTSETVVNMSYLEAPPGGGYGSGGYGE